MVEIYTLTTRALNGSVTIMTHNISFKTLELAEKAEEAIRKANKNSKFPVITDIQPSMVFENEEEIPMLNKQSAILLKKDQDTIWQQVKA